VVAGFLTVIRPGRRADHGGARSGLGLRMEPSASVLRHGKNGLRSPSAGRCRDRHRPRDGHRPACAHHLLRRRLPALPGQDRALSPPAGRRRASLRRCGRDHRLRSRPEPRTGTGPFPRARRRGPAAIRRGGLRRPLATPAALAPAGARGRMAPRAGAAGARLPRVPSAPPGAVAPPAGLSRDSLYLLPALACGRQALPT